MPNTTVAALSGRHLEGLKRVFPLREPVLLGGSHGAESSWQDTALTPQMQEHLDRKEAEIRELMERFLARKLRLSLSSACSTCVGWSSATRIWRQRPTLLAVHSTQPVSP